MEERELEMADALAESERSASIANARRRLAPEFSEDFDGSHCIGCDGAIPAVRLAMGRIRCTSCQTIIEQRKKRFAR